MAFNVRHPLWISTIKSDKAYAFAGLFFLECLARASLVTVISLQAFQILQNGQKVSFLYTSVAICTFTLSFTIPYLIKLTARRYIYSLGAMLVIVSAIAITTQDIIGQTTAMLFRTFGTACLNITLSLYIMDHIRKQDLVKSEPIRLLYSTFAWVGAPFIGVLLWREYGIWATATFCATASLAAFTVFWYLRLSDKIQAAIAPPVNPFKNFFRFWSQPRLRLAWLLAFSRSTWWITFFIYTPIYMVTAGKSEYVAATVIMLGNLSLLVNIATSRIAEKISIKRLLLTAYIMCGSFTIAIGFLHTTPTIATACFIIAAAFISFSDGLSAIPFMRSVHPYEREAMTTVYRTFMDGAELLPPLVYGLALFILPLNHLFTILGLWLLFTATITYIFLPKKL